MEAVGDSYAGEAIVQPGMDGSQYKLEARNEEEGAIVVAAPEATSACLMEGLESVVEPSERYVVIN